MSKSNELNWLCRTFGHKWITRRRHRIDGMRTESETVWPNCVRCGEDAPDSILTWLEDLADMEENRKAMKRYTKEQED